MCGILGYIGKRGFDSDAFARALDLMAARGPDDRGIHEEPEVLLGHRRLAIIDLSPGGRQPMASGDGRYLIVFNGEIYNYQAIRGELQKQGVTFRTGSDTEVILAAYAHKGASCLDDFRGMFAFAIYDRLDRSIFLVRDRMGIKPLYLWRFPGGIAFASEVKALRALPNGPSQLDSVALWNYLLWGSVPEPFTITQGIECLPPATWLKWTRDRETTGTYWRFPTDGPRFTRREEVLEALRPALQEAVALRCIADVPVGAFLSGGVDSSSVVSLMRAAGQDHLHTFSISFPQTELDESRYALKVAEQFGTIHNDVPVTEHTVRHELDGFFAAMDQPTADGLNTYLVSRVARSGGLKVALSGLGGDELFAGYPSFRRIARAALLVSRFPRAAMQAAGQVAKYFPGRSKKLEALGTSGTVTDRLYFAARGLFMPSQARAILDGDVLAAMAARQAEIGGPSVGAPARGSGGFASFVGAPGYSVGASSRRDLYRRSRQDAAPTKKGRCRFLCGSAFQARPHGWSALHHTMYLELRRYMHNQLLRDSDVFGMAHGVEIRVPLIDHAIADILFRTDPAVILQGPSKSLLFDALPTPLPRICTHRPKMGFTFPFDRWMKGTWRTMIEEALLARASGNGAGSLFDRRAVEAVWRDYLAGRVHWSRPWAVYAARRLFERPAGAPACAK